MYIFLIFLSVIELVFIVAIANHVVRLSAMVREVMDIENERIRIENERTVAFKNVMHTHGQSAPLEIID